MFYKNISQTHEHKKVPIIISELKNAINDFDITQVIILGAQNREDVYQLIVQSLCFDIKVICIEYRKEEIATWLPHIEIWKNFFNKCNLLFMNKVNEILEKNLSTEKYRIDKLCVDIGMSRTAFYSKIKDIIGMSPEDYIYSFKMDKALKLLASQQFNISEIAGMLGYCDVQYFRKKFKDFYHVCPTDYIKSIIG